MLTISRLARYGPGLDAIKTVQAARMFSDGNKSKASKMYERFAKQQEDYFARLDRKEEERNRKKEEKASSSSYGNYSSTYDDSRYKSSGTSSYSGYGGSAYNDQATGSTKDYSYGSYK